eukprot:1094954-Prorocentrum_minimum.AAC.5
MMRMLLCTLTCALPVSRETVIRCTAGSPFQLSIQVMLIRGSLDQVAPNHRLIRTVCPQKRKERKEEIYSSMVTSSGSGPSIAATSRSESGLGIVVPRTDPDSGGKSI